MAADFSTRNFYEVVPVGLKLHIRLTPNAGHNRLDQPMSQADGSVVLKVRVTAVPEKGKANAALIKLLAKQLRLPKGSFEIIAGLTDRRKTVLIHDADIALAELIATQFGQEDAT